MNTFDVYWAPEGRLLVTVEANGIARAKRMAPPPYRKYLGELYVLEVTNKRVMCDITSACLRHDGGCTK